MPHIDTISYVSRLELQFPESPFEISDYGFEVAREIIREKEEQSFLADKSMISFASGVIGQNRKDILNSTLLAQLAANKRFSLDTDMLGWYKTYIDVLSKLGWVIEVSEVSVFESKKDLFEIEHVIIDILTTAFGAGFISVINKSLDSIKKLADTDGRIKVFEKNTHSLSKGCFQIALATEENGVVSMQMSTFLLTSTNAIKKILFFKSSKDKTKLEYSSRRATLNTDVYSVIREFVLKKLGHASTDFIAELEIDGVKKTTVYNDDLIIELKKPTGNGIAVTEGATELFTGGYEMAAPAIEYSNLWDKAHQVKKNNPLVGYIEPDFENLYKFKTQYDNLSNTESFTTGDPCGMFNGYDNEWSYPLDNRNKPLEQFWHLGDNFSQLKSARDAVKNFTNLVRIAHFDTGYDPSHICYADQMIRHDLERNFVEKRTPRSAVDKYSEGPLKMPGHGTGTLSILAGATLDLPQYLFKDSIGLNHKIEIVPVRVSKSVVLFKNSAFAEALDYIISLYDDPSTRCHIVTMSMGGAASRHWAEKINEAYEKGIFIVTAAGNNFGRATPRTLVYPARFNRVVAACGVTYNYSPYYKTFHLSDMKLMQGNFGPRRVMNTAIAAFTPNVPWAKIGCRNVISLSGAGTSSATPQVASAAALYYQKYYKELEALPEPWMKIEAIRFALFSTALKKINSDDGDVEIYFGNGILQANEMLKVLPEVGKLKKTEKDKIFLPLFLQILSELNPFEVFEKDEELDEDIREMFETELLQLIQESATLQKMLDNEEKTIDELSRENQVKFFNIVLHMPNASNALKDLIRKNLMDQAVK